MSKEDLQYFRIRKVDAMGHPIRNMYAFEQRRERPPHEVLGGFAVLDAELPNKQACLDEARQELTRLAKLRGESNFRINDEDLEATIKPLDSFRKK